MGEYSLPLAQIMKPTEASVKLTYDKVKGGLYSIKLRICYQQERPRYHLPVKEGVLVKPDLYKRLVHYHQTRSGKTAAEVVQLYGLVAPFIVKAETIIKAMPSFTFAGFDRQFYSEKGVIDAPTDMLGYLRSIATTMDLEGRIGNGNVFKNARASLVAFLKFMSIEDRQRLEIDQAEVLPFDKITLTFLNAYEQWMLRFGKRNNKPGQARLPASITTVGIYLTHVRTAFRQAIADKLIPEDIYPFGAKQFMIPKGTSTKKALKKSVIRQIIELELEPGSLTERSRDLWVLSYLCNGMNMADIVRLRWNQIDYQAGIITFVRQKTYRTRRANQVNIVVILLDESKAIIERWANPVRTPSGFVFPFLEDGLTAYRELGLIKNLINLNNRHMKKVGAMLGLTGDLRTYAARHSFGSALLKSGADLIYIRDKFGHSSIKTTEIYTSSIHDEDEQVSLRKSLLDD